MILVLKSIEDVKLMKEILLMRPTKKGFDAKSFCGKLKANEDAMVIQYRLRNEWD